MTIYRLEDYHTEQLDKQPELAMGIQIAHVEDTFMFVLGGRVAFVQSEETQSKVGELLALFRSEDTADPADKMSAWLAGLTPCARFRVLRKNEMLPEISMMRVQQRPSMGRNTGTPTPPKSVYGHLPFAARSLPTEVFYRFEAFPTSRRLQGKKILAGTFAMPESENPFTPTGLSAVARLALPLLLPAVWKYRIGPKTGTHFHVGASVPLYGQSGGSVEVCFHKTAWTIDPIPRPKKIAEF